MVVPAITDLDMDTFDEKKDSQVSLGFPTWSYEQWLLNPLAKPTSRMRQVFDGIFDILTEFGCDDQKDAVLQ